MGQAKMFGFSVSPLEKKELDDTVRKISAISTLTGQKLTRPQVIITALRKLGHTYNDKLENFVANQGS